MGGGDGGGELSAPLRLCLNLETEAVAAGVSCGITVELCCSSVVREGDCAPDSQRVCRRLGNYQHSVPIYLL